MWTCSQNSKASSTFEASSSLLVTGLPQSQVWADLGLNVSGPDLHGAETAGALTTTAILRNRDETT